MVYLGDLAALWAAIKVLGVLLALALLSLVPLALMAKMVPLGLVP